MPTAGLTFQLLDGLGLLPDALLLGRVVVVGAAVGSAVRRPLGRGRHQLGRDDLVRKNDVENMMRTEYTLINMLKAFFQ